MSATATRRERRREALTYAGIRSASFARSTGTLVLVAEADAAGLDSDGGTQPWYTLCDDHGGICSHETIDLARSWSSAPEEWCPYCQDIRDASTGEV